MWRSIATETFVAKVLSLATSYAFVASYLIKSKYLFAETHRTLDENQLWDTKAPRCYLYSEADKLVDCQGIIQVSKPEGGKHQSASSGLKAAHTVLTSRRMRTNIGLQCRRRGMEGNLWQL